MIPRFPVKEKKFEFILSQSVSTELDVDKLVEDYGESLLQKYTKNKTSLRLTTSKIKED